MVPNWLKIFQKIAERSVSKNFLGSTLYFIGNLYLISAYPVFFVEENLTLKTSLLIFIYGNGTIA